MNKLQVKYFNLLQEYSNEVSEANYPYSEKSGQYPEKHPFEDAPAEILDDEELMLECFEYDYAECWMSRHAAPNIIVLATLARNATKRVFCAYRLGGHHEVQPQSNKTINTRLTS